MERRLAALAVLILLFLAACNGQPTPLTGDGDLNLSDPDVGGGAGIVLPNETPGPLPSPTSAATRDTAPRATTLAPLTLPSPTDVPATTPPEPSAEPSPTEQQVEPTSEVSDPTADSAESEETAEPDPAEVAPTAGPTTHIVVAGENLYRIGLQYGISYIALAEYNGISNADSVAVGQELLIPPAEAVEDADATATPTPVVAAEPTAEPPDDEAASPEATSDVADAGSTPDAAGTPVSATPTAERTHTVQPGENLYRISQQFGVNWALIAEANGLISPNQIVVGQVLKIPTNAPGPAEQFTHQVHAGESLFRIALQYGVPLSALAEANGLLVSTVIYPGQVLVIPGQGE